MNHPDTLNPNRVRRVTRKFFERDCLFAAMSFEVFLILKRTTDDDAHEWPAEYWGTWFSTDSARRAWMNRVEHLAAEGLPEAQAALLGLRDAHQIS